MAGKPKEDEDRRHADKPPADKAEQEQPSADKPEDPPSGVPPYKD
ncbi:hypothetical protein [Bradyrhizobium japonicum]|nr:hypothetical protein [Bradyrhizobium japonicum]MCP1761969.1 hypothetical protein [Bradyrhizobium japonicum]MCP1793549.1 hypothetical protein [Bradyrhizobium japonicum]MCP1805982.1 hypothetical protein [Bradyrhizobium japonicum]MCP1812385.1 hypothetical protein [Bradyrhizobium japonicum]MCP1873572.1 hypothetical protein [Bradyrhizobium japonicum]